MGVVQVATYNIVRSSTFLILVAGQCFPLGILYPLPKFDIVTHQRLRNVPSEVLVFFRSTKEFFGLEPEAGVYGVDLAE